MGDWQLLAGVDVASTAGRLFVNLLETSVAERGRFVVNLSGGSTPLDLYTILAERTDLAWRHTWVVWGDERFVPPNHPLSNAGAAKSALLDRVSIPDDHILTWPWSDGLTPEETAGAYREQLEGALGVPPTFDLTLLGLGEDGHTASLFPGTGAVYSTDLATVVRPSGVATARLTMSPAALSRSRVVAFLVRGEGKRAALEATLSGTGDLDRFPARAIGAIERLLWITDLSDLEVAAGS